MHCSYFDSIIQVVVGRAGDNALSGSHDRGENGNESPDDAANRVSNPRPIDAANYTLTQDQPPPALRWTSDMGLALAGQLPNLCGNVRRVEHADRAF